MTVKMIAAKRFRLPQDKGFRWLDKGEAYEVASEETADFHESTGRGNRKAPKAESEAPAKAGKKGA